MADVKISELPVATAIASPDVAPIVQGGVTKQANVGLFAGLSGSIADQQIAFGSGTGIAGSDNFKWDNDNIALLLQGGSAFTPVADSGDIRIPKAFIIEARNNADDDNFRILEKKVTSGHDNLVLGDPGHGLITFSGLGENMTINPPDNGTVNITAITGAISLSTDPTIGYSTDVHGDLEVSDSGWVAMLAQTRANLIANHLVPPFEGIIYAESTDHHVYYYNGSAFKQFAEVGDVLQLTPIVDPPSSPTEGMIYADTDHHLYYYNGSTWKQLDN